jgi:hypothetical protein
MESSIREARGRFARPSETPYQKLIDHHKFYDLEDSQDFYDFDVKTSGIMTECCGLTISKNDSSLFDKRESCRNALNPICKGRNLPPCRFMPAFDRRPLLQPPRGKQNANQRLCGRCRFCRDWENHETASRKLLARPDPPLAPHSFKHPPRIATSISNRREKVLSNVCESGSCAEVSFIHKQSAYGKTPLSTLSKFLEHSSGALGEKHFNMVLIYNSATDALSIGVYTEKRGGLFFDHLIADVSRGETLADDLRIGVAFNGRCLAALKLVFLGTHALRTWGPASLLSNPTTKFPFDNSKPCYKLFFGEDAADDAARSGRLLLRITNTISLSRIARRKLVNIYLASKLRQIFLNTHSKRNGVGTKYGSLNMQEDEISFYCDNFLPQMTRRMGRLGERLPDDNRLEDASKIISKYESYLENLEQAARNISTASALKTDICEGLGNNDFDRYMAPSALMTTAGYHARDFEFCHQTWERINEVHGFLRPEHAGLPRTESNIFYGKSEALLRQKAAAAAAAEVLPVHSTNRFTDVSLGLFEERKN